MEKKITLIELNEFNINFLKDISFKYNLKNLKKLFKLNIIDTYTNDEQEHYNLDPWVQWVSIHLGIESKKHQIYELGDIKKSNRKQIWDFLVQKKN